MTRPRVAVIGLGMAVAPHALALAELGDRLEVATCFSPTPARRQAFAGRFPGLPVTDDLEAIFADRSIDAIILLTPPTTHLDLVLRAAAAGKHVLVEKPIEVTVARGEAMIAAMEKAGCTLAVVLQHRFRPAARRLSGLLGDGGLGRVLSASAAIRWWRPPDYYAQPGRGMKARDGGGVLLTQAIHTLDLFMSLAGPITHVAAMAGTSPARSIDTEDVVGAAVRFANDALGTIDATTLAYPGFPERIEIAGELGTAVLSAEALEVHFKDGRTLAEGGTPANSGGGGADPMAFSHGPHKALIADFADAISTGRQPVTAAREAIRVQVLIEAILRSAATGRTEALA